MKKNNTMRNATIAAVIGGMGIAGYNYLKKNPNVVSNMKSMAKSAAKKAYDALDEKM